MGQDTVRVANRQLTLLRTKLESIDAAVRVIDDAEEDATCTLEEQVIKIKAELAMLKTSLLASDVPTDDPIMQDQTLGERVVFGHLLKIKKHLRGLATTPTKATEAFATKLPKLELPTFHGDILRWKNFWEQFCVFVHNRMNIPKEEKLMYLQNVIKDKTAKSLIAGFTKLSDHYDEAVKCLQERYDHPRQIHQTHVRHIVEAPPLKDGTGKEIRALHDLVINISELSSH